MESRCVYRNRGFANSGQTRSCRWISKSECNFYEPSFILQIHNPKDEQIIELVKETFRKVKKGLIVPVPEKIEKQLPTPKTVFPIMDAEEDDFE